MKGIERDPPPTQPPAAKEMNRICIVKQMLQIMWNHLVNDEAITITVSHERSLRCSSGWGIAMIWSQWLMHCVLLLKSSAIPMDVQFSSLRSRLVLWRCERTVCQSAVCLFLGCFKQNAPSLEVVQLLRKPPSLPWTSLIFPMSFCLYLCPSISASPPWPLSVSLRELMAWMRCFFFFFFLTGEKMFISSWKHVWVLRTYSLAAAGHAVLTVLIAGWLQVEEFVGVDVHLRTEMFQDLRVSFSCWHFISGMLRGRGHMMM